MSDDKRSSDKPIPDNINDYLTEAQFAELHHIESFGWTLKYIFDAHYFKSERWLL